MMLSILITSALYVSGQHGLLVLMFDNQSRDHKHQTGEGEDEHLLFGGAGNVIKVGSIYSLFGLSKQTEPFYLPDNHCLTIGLRVQRYDYFFI